MGNCDCDDDGDCAEFAGGVCANNGGPTGVDPGITQGCFVPACRSNADCNADQLCMPAGIHGPVSECIAASCRDNQSCTREAGGKCRLFASDDGEVVGCVYPSDPCDIDRPCAPEADGDERRPRTCGFAAGTVACVVDPGPPP